MKHNLPKKSLHHPPSTGVTELLTSLKSLLPSRIPHRKLLLPLLIFLLFFSLSFLFSIFYFGKFKIPNTSSIRVPESDDQAKEKGVAVPQSVIALSDNDTGKRRTFQISLEKNRFSVEKIAVYQNDIVNIRITAGDRDYDFTIPALGIRQEAEKGQSRIAEFQAVGSGTFEFLCPSCGDGAKGLLIIVPNKLTTRSYFPALTNLSHLSYDENIKANQTLSKEVISFMVNIS